MGGGKRISNISREFGAGKFCRNMIYKTRGQVVYQLFPSSLQNDYKQYMPMISNGFTKIDIQYINQSIESYLYCIPGAQAKTQVIFSNRGSALEGQRQFRKLIKVTIFNYDISTSINNMNRVITDCNKLKPASIGGYRRYC